VVNDPFKGFGEAGLRINVIELRRLEESGRAVVVAIGTSRPFRHVRFSVALGAERTSRGIGADWVVGF
jgi:hypothetical protein